MRKAVGKWFYFTLLFLCAAAVFALVCGGNAMDSSISVAVGDETEIVINADGQKQLVDLNTADIETLELLPEITPSVAERIVEYRETFGRFWSTEDLMDVEGISVETYEIIRDIVTVGG